MQNVGIIDKIEKYKIWNKILLCNLMADKQNTEVIRQLLKDCNKWTPNDNIRYSPFTGTGTVIIKIPIECLLIDQSINEYNLSIEIMSTSDVEMKFEQTRII